MNYFRKLVSGKRNRHVCKNYDLDITYVSDRVLGMSFPASGFEQTYRNRIEDVACFLEAKHKDHYLIVNLSNRKYDYKKFNNKVIDYPWEDHHSPALNVLFEVCQQMFLYLKEHPENIVIINCNAGKGRTGTSICAFFLFSGLSDITKDAINFYGWRRFSHGRGVSQPSQVRYIHYFEKVYKGQVVAPVIKILDKVIVTTIPKVSSKRITPYLEVMNGNDFSMIYTNKNSFNLRSYKTSSQLAIDETISKVAAQEHQISSLDKNLLQESKESIRSQLNLLQMRTLSLPEDISSLQKQITIQIDQDPILFGDVYFRLMNKGQLGNKKICRFAINTSFVKNNYYELTKFSVDPDSIQKDARFSHNFKIELFFRDYCIRCTAQTPLEQLCQNCKHIMQDDLGSWETIHRILSTHTFQTHEEGAKLNFTKMQLSEYYELSKKETPVRLNDFQTEGYYESYEDEEDSEPEDLHKPVYKSGRGSNAEESKQPFQTIVEQQEEGSEIGMHEEEQQHTSFIKAAPKIVLQKSDAISNKSHEHLALQEKEKHDRKDLLQVDNIDDEFIIKKGTERRKSLDILRETDRTQSLLKEKMGKQKSFMQKVIEKEKQESQFVIQPARIRGATEVHQ